jgi:very-short-patch-repair endonuclease
MTRIFNRASEKEKRRGLRKNMTKAEVLLWIQLKNRKLLGQRVLRQYGIGPYVVDFYIPKLRLAIEVDGATHGTEEEKQYDTVRQEEIEAVGIQFIRRTNLEVYHDMNHLLERIKEGVEQLTQ